MQFNSKRNTLHLFTLLTLALCSSNYLNINGGIINNGTKPGDTVVVSGAYVPVNISTNIKRGVDLENLLKGLNKIGREVYKHTIDKTHTEANHEDQKIDISPNPNKLIEETKSTINEVMINSAEFKGFLEKAENGLKRIELIASKIDVSESDSDSFHEASSSDIQPRSEESESKESLDGLDQ